MSKKVKKTQKAGAWFNGDNSPLMIDSPIAPNLFQVIQQTGGNQQRVQQPRVQQPRVQVQQPRVQVQQQFPQPSRQVNETYASFNQQGGKHRRKIARPHHPLLKQPHKPHKCVKQTDKKYLERPSPPFPANECCGMTIVGNNSKPWISKANVNGICRWVEIKKE